MSDSIITSRDSFQRWLRDKPFEWGQAVTVRAVMRALPSIAYSNSEWTKQYSLPLLRSSFMIWANWSVNSPVIQQGLRHAADFNPPLRNISRNSANACTAIITASNSFFNGQRSLNTFPYVVANAAAALEKHYSGIHQPSSWKEINADCRWLENIGAANPDSYLMSSQPLWLTRPQRYWIDTQPHFYNWLAKISGSRSIWADWYDQRIKGDRATFDIPGDKSRFEDAGLLIRIAGASSDNLWSQGHEHVNTTLKSWLEEARLRIAPFPRPDSIESIPTMPVQNLNAISFRTDETGKIAINASALLGALRADEVARERHAEAVREASEWLDKCRTSNAAARLVRLLENYLDSAGDGLETMKPSLFVQRGERLRQELSRYDLPDHMLPPVADELLLDGKGWQSAHNMTVGLDPILNASDTAMLGPDRQPVLISPMEIREKARDADKAEILSGGVIEVIEEAADLAPAIPDPADRRTVWSTEMARNLLIETFALALNHPYVSGSALIATSIATSVPVASIASSISVLSSIKAAEYLVGHRQWIVERMGNTPTWQALFVHVVDWLEKVTPFKPK